MFVKPMLATPIDVMPSGDEWVAESKFDGWRTIAGRPKDGESWLKTRTANAITAVPYLAAALDQLLPPDSVVDGELIARDGSFRYVQAIAARTGGWVHRPCDESPPLVLAVFDVLRLDGVDVRDQQLHVRRSLLDKLITESTELFEVPFWYPSSAASLEALLDAGYEGAVVKHLASRYHPAQRSSQWGKFKAVETLDCICTGFFRGSGSNDDPAWWAQHGSEEITGPVDGPGPATVGGMTFRTPTGVDGRMGGLTDSDAAHMAAHPEKYIGRVVEVKHSRGDIGDSGALRHPRFGRMRDPADKPAEELAASSGRARQATGPPRQASAAPPTRRRRNYKAMGDRKLLAAIDHLANGSGDAYERCIESGSGDPASDLEHAQAIAAERGL